MESIAENYTKEAELQNKIRAAVTYPMIVLIIAILGVLAMVTFIVPVFENMFAGLGQSLPLPTQILVNLSQQHVVDPAADRDRRDRRGSIWWRATRTRTASGESSTRSSSRCRSSASSSRRWRSRGSAATCR